MGCAASSPVASAPPANDPRAQEQQQPAPSSAPQPQPQPHAPAEPEPAAPARPAEGLAAADSTPFDFELHTPMLVMPYAAFKAQGRIFKSVKAWREEALREGRLTVHAEAGRDHRGKIVVFISHTWWDRDFLDPDRDPNDPYDKGAPDYQSGNKQDLKWRVICSGVESLVKQEGLNEEDVALWLDWQSIFQDDKAEKQKGVLSLLKYATLCDYMLVPTERAQLELFEAKYPEEIPGYGARGWCRCEYFIFSLAAEMREREVELYAVLSGGGLQKYPAVKVQGARYMPSGGAFANPADKASVQKLENKMIEAYGTAVVVAKCRAGGAVDLSNKMLRAVHMDALGAAVAKYDVETLNLEGNPLGADGGKALAAVMSQMPSLKELILFNNEFGPKGGAAIAEGLKGNTTLKELNIRDNKLGVEGGKAFAAVLKDTQLTILNVRDNSLRAKGGKAIAAVLKDTRITTLDIGYNRLGVEGSKAFAAVLKDTQLTNLNIAGNALTNNGKDMSGVLKLVEALPQTKLTSLNLRSNSLTDNGKDMSGVLKLAEVLPQTKLTSLDLQSNGLDDAAKQAVQEAAGSGVKLAL